MVRMGEEVMSEQMCRSRQEAGCRVCRGRGWGLMAVFLCVLGFAGMPPASADGNLGADCPVSGSALRLEVLTEAMTCTAYGSPRVYAFEGSLRLRLDSPAAAWRMRMRSEDLVARSGHSIPARAVQVRVGQEWLPLARALTVAHGGPARRIELEFPLRLATDEITPPGKYAGCLLIGVETPSGDRVPIQQVPLQVDVGARIRNSYRGNRIYFHFGIGARPLTATVNGRIDSEVPVCLVLSAEQGKAGELLMLRPMSSRTPAKAVLPLQWRLSERGTGPARPPDKEARDHSTLSWRLHSTPGKGEYELHCKARPQATQPPGDYGQQLTLTVVPLM